MRTWEKPVLPKLNTAASAACPTELKLVNRHTGELEKVGNEQLASLYVCGITPYDATHLGHAFTYLTFDLLQRVWFDLGYPVQYVQNITDVDDPLLERAEQTSQDWREIAASQIELFASDMAALNVLPPQTWAAVSEEIDHLAEEITKLADLGLVYQIEDEYPDWYFKTRAMPGYGDISGLDEQTQLAEFAAKGGDPDRAGKLDPFDALVWRMARPGEPSWQTPLGAGRPGWHIECTAIAQRYLPAGISVQGGGLDLIFPHHEMCAAIGRAASSQPFAAHYVHAGMVSLDGAKMSKSLGNLELVSRLRARGIEPAVIRLAIISHHYRSDWEWFEAEIAQASERLACWRGALALVLHPVAPVIDLVRASLRTDLDTPAAIAAIDEWARAQLAGGLSGEEPVGELPAENIELAKAIDALLGIKV